MDPKRITKITSLFLILIPVLLYIAQVIVFINMEEQDSRTVDLKNGDKVYLKVLLGNTKADKYIPGIGALIIFTRDGCRLEAKYKYQFHRAGIDMPEDCPLKELEIIEYEKFITINHCDPFNFTKEK